MDNLNPEGLPVVKVESEQMVNHLLTAAAQYKALAALTTHERVRDAFEHSQAQCERWAAAIGIDSILVTT